VILLVTHGHPTMLRHRHPNLGRLVQPRHYSSIEATAYAGIPWAADNDCYQGLDEEAWIDMLDRLAGLPGCLFCAVPDVVGDYQATDDRWVAYAEEVWKRGLPAAYVLQDGCPEIPREARAVFVGGTTEFKIGPEAADLVARAKTRGLWTHMGRVNGPRRIRYARSIGVQSVDGSSWARWEKTLLPRGLEHVSDTTPVASPTWQLSLEDS